MKRILSFCLMIGMLISALGLSSSALNKSSPEIKIDSYNVSAGEDAYVNICIKNNPGIVAMCINVSFDSGLMLVGAENGKTFPKSMAFILPKQLSNGGSITGNCNFAWQGIDIADSDIKDGIILKLNFKVSDKAEAGDAYNINVTSRFGDVVDRNFEIIEISPADGVIEIVGDNSDSKANQTNSNFMKVFIEWIRRILSMLKEIASKTN